MSIFEIAKSYVFSKNKSKLTKVHSYIASIGIIIGVTALIVVSSAMSGFSEYMYQKLGLTWDVELILKNATTQQRIDLEKELMAKEDFVDMKSFTSYENVKVNGLNSNIVIVPEDYAIENGIKDGVLNISKLLSDVFLENKSSMYLLSIKNIEETIIEAEIMEQENGNYRDVFITKKTFDEHFFTSELDKHELQILKVDIENIFKTKSYDYFEKYEYVLETKAWHKSRPSMYETLQIEQTVIKIVLFFIILVSCFNIISTLTLIITEKKQDIFVLKTIGYSDSYVLFIFLATGAWLGIVGLAFGTLFGILITMNLTEILFFLESFIGIKLIPEGIIMFPYIVNPKEIITINLLTGSFIAISSFLPSMNTLSINPAEGLKDE